MGSRDNIWAPVIADEARRRHARPDNDGALVVELVLFTDGRYDMRCSVDGDAVARFAPGAIDEFARDLASKVYEMSGLRPVPEEAVP